MNCCATASYVLYMKSATKNIDLSKFGMVYYNNLLSIPLLLPFAFSFGEFATISNTMEVVTDPMFVIINLVAGSMGYSQPSSRRSSSPSRPSSARPLRL